MAANDPRTNHVTITDLDSSGPYSGAISRRITEMFGSLGSREQDVAREILRQYPISALCTVATLAERSNVSTATVLRLVQRLDLNAYSAFQDVVKADVSRLLETPLQRLSAQSFDAEPDGTLLSELLDSTARQLQKCHNPVMDADFRSAIGLLADPRHRIYCAGGHRSRHVAALLTEYLGLLRPHVQLVEGPPEGWPRYLLDMNAQTVVIATDIRRYQPSLLRFSSLAAERGAHVIAISDAWADNRSFGAHLLFRMPSSSSSPFDSHCGQLLLAEALIGGLATEIGPSLNDRLELGEALRYQQANSFDPQPNNTKGT
jgi:DNA-binding MurR/RpiR family transcriptional regulator